MKSSKRVAYLDCISGVSGDMILGAILDCGVPLDELRRELKKVDLPPYSLDVRRVERGVLSAAKAIVRVKGDEGPEAAMSHGRREHSHTHTDPHLHAHGRRDAHGHERESHAAHSHADKHATEPRDEPSGHAHGPHGHGRSLQSILGLLETSRLSPKVRGRAQAIFRRLGQAEARVHGTTLEQVHFHEVGAVDAIVDVVGASAGFERLGIERFYASEIPLGSGEVVCQHGTLPVPAPAVTALLEGARVRLGDTGGELVTPTGAAILSTVVDDFRARPRFRIERAGYGAGDRDLPERPNVFRLVIGTEEGPLETPSARVVVLETNLDDAQPQLVAHAIDRLLAAGALDAFAESIQMKKGRFGIKLSAIGEPGSESALEAVMFRETTTFGVRRYECARTTLEREWLTVSTPFGEARVKVGSLGGAEIRTPEYEDCLKLAERSGSPLRDVLAAVSDAARRAPARAPRALRAAPRAPRRSRGGKRSGPRRKRPAR